MYAAVVTGPNGQDGSYICELLREKGYHLVKFQGDVRNYDEVFTTIQSCVDFERIEVYNLAAKIHGSSPTEIFQVNTMGILNIMEAVKNTGEKSKYRIFQASSSEIFANYYESPQTVYTQRAPRNMYGLSKVTCDAILKHYKEEEGYYACSGILYNHESPRRPDTYVTQKIIKGLQSDECLQIGNLDSKRDWGHAKDYVKAMWLILQQSTPEDYIVATGKTHTVREFIEIALQKMNKSISWSGDIGIVDGKTKVKICKEFYRPDDKNELVGNPSKLEGIGWTREYDIDNLIEDMIYPTLMG